MNIEQIVIPLEVFKCRVFGTGVFQYDSVEHNPRCGSPMITIIIENTGAMMGPKENKTLSPVNPSVP